MRLRPILAAAIATLALTVTGCAGTEDTPTSGTRTAAVQPAPTVTPDDLAEHTRQTFDVTWAMASETERDTYCTSIALLGPDQAADRMAEGAGYDDSLDWPLTAQLMQTACADR